MKLKLKTKLEAVNRELEQKETLDENERKSVNEILYEHKSYTDNYDEQIRILTEATELLSDNTQCEQLLNKMLEARLVEDEAQSLINQITKEIALLKKL